MEAYVGALRRHIWLIVFVVVGMTAAAYAVTSAQPAKYQATSELLVNQAPTVALPQLANTQATDALSLQRRISTQIELARVPTVAAAALRDANVRDITPTQLLAQVSLSSKPDTDLVTIAVTAGSPPSAELLATSYAKEVARYLQTLHLTTLAQQRALLSQSIANQLQSSPSLAAAIRDHTPLPPNSAYSQLVSSRNDVIAAEAEDPASAVLVSGATSAVQVAPKPSRNTALALALALLLGCLLAYVIDRLGNRAHTTLETSRALGMPLLATVPPPRRPPGRKRWSAHSAKATLTMLTDPGSPHAEAIKMLQANLELAHMNHGSTVVLCTSAVSGEGKSTTLVNLAVSLAQAGREVVLVDADLRRPVLTRMLGVSAASGIAELAHGGHASLQDVSTESLSGSSIVRGRLRLMPAGAPVEQPDRLLSSPALEKAFADFRASADYVLVDSPPMTEVYDSLILCRYVDAMIGVARVGHVKLPSLAEFARLLSTTSVLPLGYVATGLKRRETSRYYDSVRIPGSEQGDEATSPPPGIRR